MMWIKVGKYRINLDQIAFVSEREITEHNKTYQVFIEFPAIGEQGDMAITLDGQEAIRFIALFDHMTQVINV